MCPLSYGPAKHAQHATMDHVSDVVFSAMKPMVDGETGEAAPEVERVAAAARYGYDINQTGMRLYVDQAVVAEARWIRTGPYVEARYFRCDTCGFVLPASAQQRAS